MVATARADLIPPGSKATKHELMFVDSECLAAHRLVAAPVRGFHGVTKIRAGQQFRFSTKYGTRFYVVPEDVDPLPEFDHEQFAQWPSAAPPKSELKFVAAVSPVASAVTRLRLVRLDEGVPQIELVSHTEYDNLGQPVTAVSYLRRVLLLVSLGAGLLVAAAWTIRRSRRKREQPK